MSALINGKYYTLDELMTPNHHNYVWVAYSKKPPYLPIAVADTTEGLAALIGVSRNTIMSNWSRYKNGLFKQCRYHKVPIEV